jgi:N-acetyltransferase
VPFDRQPTLDGELVAVRPLRQDDFEALHTAAADPLIWEQHPEPGRWRDDEFRTYFDGHLASDGAVAVVEHASGAIIGASRYDNFDEVSEVEIGWTFLARPYWGGRHNADLKRVMLDHAFGSVDTVVFLVGNQNLRSRRAVEKLGAVVKGTRRGLVLYELTKEAFAAWRSGRRTAFVDVEVFVRANLPDPPARLLEVGAGEGRLARALTEAGYEVDAIDPVPGGPGVRAAALHELEDGVPLFDAAIAVVSLHHVHPLEDSLHRLAEVLKPGAAFVVDEFDVDLFDRRAAAWWLEQRAVLGAIDLPSPENLVAEYRAHLHPLEAIVVALEPYFAVGKVSRGAYLHRWALDESLRGAEEDLIARDLLPAVGARIAAHRRS